MGPTRAINRAITGSALDKCSMLKAFTSLLILPSLPGKGKPDHTPQKVGLGFLRQKLAQLYQRLRGQDVLPSAKGIELGAFELTNKGVSLARLGRKEEALKAFDEAQRINPGYDLAWYKKGDALDDLGRSEEAMHAYDEALLLSYDARLRINLEDAAKWYDKGFLLADLGRREEVIVLTTQLVPSGVSFRIVEL